MIYDVAIIGAGIAGASLAAELAPHLRVVLVEAEAQPGYHSTGRSNALWHESYGGPGVQPLTTASLAALKEGHFLKPRDAITLGRVEDLPEIQAFLSRFSNSDIQLELLDRQSLDQRYPALNPEWQHGIMEANCFDIDVAGVHQLFLSLARKAGADVRLNCRVEAMSRQGENWKFGEGEARIVVNAAGGWAGNVAELCGASPIAITPYRRTITQLRLSQPVNPDLPFLIDVDGSFYFRPEGADRVWLSPHDETETPACDAAPDELDIAIAIERFQRVVDWPIAAVEHSWAGLRSFAPDRLPVYGFDPAVPNFFWCAGQGGFGIQTAPAAAKLCAALITGNAADTSVAGIDPAVYAPSRFA